jgi:mRNA interferase MazF
MTRESHARISFDTAPEPASHDRHTQGNYPRREGRTGGTGSPKMAPTFGLMQARSHSPKYGTTLRTMTMPSFSKNDVVLVAYPFSDRSGVKVRPAVVVSGEHRSRDVFVVPLTSKTDRMIEGEFSLADWHGAGLNVASVVKRGLYTIHESLVIKMVGRLGTDDARQINAALRQWLGL